MFKDSWLGIVVDAIVVVENVQRHIDEGMLSKEAAKKAMTEVFGPIIATTLVLLAVFVSVAFMSGISGQLYRQFLVTLFSLNVLTLSPALCSIFYAKEKARPSLPYAGSSLCSIWYQRPIFFL